MEELKLEIKEIEFDEKLAEKNIKENSELFHEPLLEDGVGEEIVIDESEVE